MGRTLFLPTSFKIVAAVGAAFVLWGLLLAYASSPAYADTIFKVNSTGDQNDLDFPGGAFDGSSDAKCDVDSTLAGDQCTLRAAIQEANVTAGEDTLGIGVTGTVNLTGVLPDLSSNIKIEGPGADKFTVRRNTGGDYRIFEVTGGTVVSISGITISGGNVPGSSGAGILNFGTMTITSSTISGNSAAFQGGGIQNIGTMTISGSTISGNSAGTEGGGIYNAVILTISGSTISGNRGNAGGGVFSSLFHSGTKTTITNSTISGNSATNQGGGLYNQRGLSVIEHSTITKNTAPNDQGSGVASVGTPTRTEVLSSIISANTNTDVDFTDATTNSFDSNGYNLIGDGNATSAFNQSGDQSRVSDPKLGALADNGGSTQTHALLAGSPAIDAIPQGTNGCGTTFTEDQRGVARPQGSRCDIGSFEVDEPTVTIDRASGQAESTTDSPIHFTAVFSEPATGFEGSDVTLGGTAGATTAVVSEQAPNDGTTYDVAVSGMSTSGTVIASIPAGAAQDADGNANSASTSTDNTVTFIANSPPTAVADNYSVNEDTTLNEAAPGILDNDTDPDPGDPLAAELVSGPSHAASFTLNADGSFDYTPSANYNGPDSFTYKANDGSEDSNTATVSITVNPVNDAPVTTDDTKTINEDDAPITIDLAGLVSDGETSNANLTYNIVSGPTPAQGTLSGTGSTRTFDSANNFNGSVEIIYTVTDRGDPDDCGTPDDDCDAPETSDQGKVTVTVSPVNDVPTVAVAAGGSCARASGTMNLTLGDAETAAGSLTLAKSSSNTTLVPNSNITFGGSGASRTVTITPVAKKSGNATITLTVSDGTATNTTTIKVIVGTDKKETINGSSGADMILGKNGDDTINAGNANDLVCGGNGGGTISGGSGDDTLDGGSGNDTLKGEDGNDTLRGGQGNDRLEGGNNDDTLTGNAGADFFSGGSGNDTATDFNAGEGDTQSTIP